MLRKAVILLLFTILTIAEYDKYLGTDLLFYAGATYRLKTSKVWNWTYSDTYPLIDGIDFTNSKYHLFGYTGYSPKLNVIVVAFRGTVLSFSNLKTDLDYYQISYEKHPSAKVHRSFYRAFKAIEGSLSRNMNTMTKKYPKAPIYFTGHSLGGALAVLAAASLAQSYQITAVYTYGEPRIGDQKFASYIDRILDVYRVINNRDPIPTIPPKKSAIETIGNKIKDASKKVISTTKKTVQSVKNTAKKGWSRFKGLFHSKQLVDTHQSYIKFSYFHEGTEVWYIPSEKTFYKCQNESPDCLRSISLYKLNPKDHLMSNYYKTLGNSISQNWSQK